MKRTMRKNCVSVHDNYDLTPKHACYSYLLQSVYRTKTLNIVGKSYSICVQSFLREYASKNDVKIGLHLLKL